MQDAEKAVTEQRIDRIETRVQTLEEFRNESEKTAIRAEEQQKAIVKSIEGVAGQVTTIKTNVSKLLWIIVGVIAVAAVKWILDGNLGSSS